MASTFGSTNYLIWWSGTEGQAAWLQYFSPALRSTASLQRMPASARDLPPLLRPLFALEHPDLVISTGDGFPLLSVEITEQQAFGTNSQQRMARMWSAVANQVPSAYLLPIESYQIDFDQSSRGERLLNSEDAIRDLALFLDGIPRLGVGACQRSGATTPETVAAAIRAGTIKLPAERRTVVSNFFRRHVFNESAAYHLPVVPPGESYHAVGKRWFRAYLRRPGVPESMVLMWLKFASEAIPAFPFQIVSDIANLFETNGIPHLLNFPEAPHLEFQNLPLPPGQGRVVHRASGQDEMTHFFSFVEGAVHRNFDKPYWRELFTEPNEYFDESVLSNWRTELELDARLTDDVSADLRMSTPRFILEIGRADPNCNLPMFENSLNGLSHVNVLRAYTSTPTRSLGDPYTGMLATRDVLFCRNGNALDLKTTFAAREEGLALWIEMRGQAASRHPFLTSIVFEQLRRNGILSEPGSLQEAITVLLQRCHPDEISKALRAHIIFCDVIVVQRQSEAPHNFEIALGLPSLMRLGVLDTSAAAFRGLFA